jgi:hypothetical protein
MATRFEGCHIRFVFLGYYSIRGVNMDVSVGDKLLMKKPHPCGGTVFSVLRVGMDFKVKCTTCGHELMAPRKNIEKSIKKIIKEQTDV